MKIAEMQYLSVQDEVRVFLFCRSKALIIIVSQFTATNSKLWADGKAENGSGMETGHGKWKRELETEI